MSKHRSKLDWEFLEDQEAPWPPAATTDIDRSSLNARRHMRRTIVFAITMVALLTAGIGTIYARNEAQKGIAEVEEGVRAAVDAEAWVQEHAPELSADMLADDPESHYVQWMRDNEQHLLAAVTQQEAPNAKLAVGDTRFAYRYAAVEVELALPLLSDGANVTADVSTDKVYGGVYRQTRFYRETPQGWLRTQPVPSLWGHPRSIETDHLIWRYRQRDEDDVLEIAQQMDALYAQMLEDYDLTRAVDDGKLTVEIQVDSLPGHVPMQKLPAQSITVPSPAVYLVPSHYASSDVLAQTVGLAFLYSLWDRASVQHGAHQFSAHLGGIMLWQLKEMESALSPTVGIAVGSLLGINRLDEICTAYAVWMVRPVSYGIPIHCDAYDGGPLTYHVPAPSLKYIALGQHVGASDGRQHLASTVYQAHDLTASVIMNTVIDYAVSVNGRESLPAFVLALSEYDSWETLVPAVYGVSLAEFEEEWRAHLTRIAG